MAMISSDEILEKLVGFATVSRTPNVELIEYVRSLLAGSGIDSRVVGSEDGRNLNLHAHVGPPGKPGVMLSGHTDVVPVKGQPWTREAFSMTRTDGRLYGRGTTDMKGFVASAVRAMLMAADRNLAVPLQLALSYDEEIGCVGVRSLIDLLATADVRPWLCIVGEPTELKVATGHKGKTAVRVTCTGKEAHSALAPAGLNAIYLATEFIGVLQEEQQYLLQNGGSDKDYDVPYSTIHVGKIQGGVALNIVPRECVLDFEIRNLAADNPEDILNRITLQAQQMTERVSALFPGTGITMEVFNTYPGLDTDRSSTAVSFVQSLAETKTTSKVAFGTEGGLFSGKLGVPTVVCGPGSMDQGHKPDEFLTVEQLDRCDLMMARLLDRLSEGQAVQAIVG